MNLYQSNKEQIEESLGGLLDKEHDYSFKLEGSMCHLYQAQNSITISAIEAVEEAGYGFQRVTKDSKGRVVAIFMWGYKR